MSHAKCYVYVLRSLADPTRIYAGTTLDWCGILDAHNSGKCSQSADGRPWGIDLLVPFTDETRASAFERYVKSGSRRNVARDRQR
jgi:predicted GIY-YIG superfamily endonuclease